MWYAPTHTPNLAVSCCCEVTDHARPCLRVLSWKPGLALALKPERVSSVMETRPDSLELLAYALNPSQLGRTLNPESCSELGLVRTQVAAYEILGDPEKRASYDDMGGDDQVKPATCITFAEPQL
eukprot:1253870-Rhodomonas_salina.2